jgi:protoporphyrinogen oxidase
MSEQQDFLIVGAGIAGLTFAHSVLEEGHKATIVERNDVVGGLARSFRYGDFVFDVGPKRFHTEDEEILAFLETILKGDYIVVDRSSAVHLFGRYFPWPLDHRALTRLPLKVMLSSAFDLLTKKPPADEKSFTDYTRSKYGETLYRLFFKPYTEKFLQIPCEDVHVDWARTGINRAVIDKRIKNETLFDLVWNVLLPRPVVTKFIYPSYGGFGTFCEKLAQEVRGRGGELSLGKTVASFRCSGDRIEEVELSDGTRHRPSCVVWSGNLVALAELLGVEPPPLRYLSTVLYNVEVHAEVKQHQQWIYYGGQDTLLSRVSITNEMAPYMSPPGKTGLCVEITCFEGGRVWEEPKAVLDEVRTDLVRLDLVGDIGDIGEVHVERIRDTYPIYDLKYKESFSAAQRMVKHLRNLKLLGRTGAYWYNNSDHSMKMSLAMARHLLRGAPMADKEALFQA